MNKLICKKCQNHLGKKQDVFVCENCGARYSVEETKKMLLDEIDKNSKSVDNEGMDDSLTTLEDTVDANLLKAREARKDENWEKVREYYEQFEASAETGNPYLLESMFYISLAKMMESLKTHEFEELNDEITEFYSSNLFLIGIYKTVEGKEISKIIEAISDDIISMEYQGSKTIDSSNMYKACASMNFLFLTALVGCISISEENTNGNEDLYKLLIKHYEFAEKKYQNVVEVFEQNVIEARQKLNSLNPSVPSNQVDVQKPTIQNAGQGSNSPENNSGRGGRLIAAILFFTVLIILCIASGMGISGGNDEDYEEDDSEAYEESSYKSEGLGTDDLYEIFYDNMEDCTQELNFLCDDFDGNGTLEAFGITIADDYYDYEYGECAAEIYFINDHGVCSVVRYPKDHGWADENWIYNDSTTDGEIVEYGDNKFFVYTEGFGGPGILAYIFGVDDEEYFEANISGRYDSFFVENGKIQAESSFIRDAPTYGRAFLVHYFKYDKASHKFTEIGSAPADIS